MTREPLGGVFSESRTTVAAPSWEAVRVGRYYGLKALTWLTVPGAVAVDPEDPGVYFFVAAGATADWPPSPARTALVVRQSLDLPPAHRRTPPGTYWLVPPWRGTIGLTDAGTLCAALADLLPEWMETPA
ncbi:hypothetical protein [Streptomyces sp. NRRL F-5126]|uniref:hypothetical protein n=1 Tax=Streptomyces sp. NRRL F-5126 TaxID=1463857 RepID=UPI00068B3D63|nr:hypothetical protein [Streptomyces sp. NRRL F-5126]